MQYKTLASAVEAIKKNQCAIKNDDIHSLKRACKYVWPECATTQVYAEFYFNISGEYLGYSVINPYAHSITATEFCRLMDEDKAEPIDLGKVFDENYDLHADNWEGHGEANAIGREKFIEVVSKLLNAEK